MSQTPPRSEEYGPFIPSRSVSSLAEAYAYCRRVTRQSSSNFYYAFRLLSTERRNALYATYAFCRFMDDITDQPAASAGATRRGDHASETAPETRDSRAQTLARLLNLWREELDYCYTQKPRHPISQALADAIQRFPIQRQHLAGIIDGVEMDLHRTRYQTFDELRDYCYHVACLVGLICIEIFGYRNPQTPDYAVNLGLALQLTNILRDVGEDAERGRIYLPAEDIVAHGYSEQELCAEVYNEAFVRLMDFEHERAREYYRRAAATLAEEDRRSLAAAEAMHFIYRRLLDEIAAQQFRVFGRRISLSSWSKIGLAASAWRRGRLGW